MKTYACWPALLLTGCFLFPDDDPPPPPPDSGVAMDAAPAETDAGPTERRPRNEYYIRGDLAQRLVIELDAVPGHAPLPSAEADLLERLQTLVDKPAGIEIRASDAIASRGVDYAWTHEELGRLAAEHFDDDDTPGTIVLHVLWVDGHDARDDETGGVTLGLAFGHQFIVMFHESLQRACQSDPILGGDVCEEAQYLVWLHEVGHTLGLVDNGLEMVTPHRDADHGAHDESDECVMYWAFESRSGITSIRDRLLGGALPDFDANCLADVARVRSD